ncbi:hypothetical protein BDR26DRAFT_271774 [Obelidium mucronatum]|nr:hypothetical protein BDR26DRAFT_271774 [Obelidium mucronatum]
MLYANHTRKGKDMQRRHSRSATSSASSVATVPSSAVSAQPVATPAGRSPLATPPPNPDLNSKPVVKLSQKKQAGAPLQTDDIAINKQHQQKKLQQQGMWTNNFEGESMSGYDSRHFFLGQSASDSAFLAPGQRSGSPPQGRDPLAQAKKEQSPLNTVDNYLGPATVTVESLDTSIMQNRIQVSPQQRQKTLVPENRNSNTSDAMDSYYMLEDDPVDKIPKIEDEETPDDPFNKFWDVVENLVQKISSTAPLQALQQQQWSPAVAPMPPLGRAIPGNSTGGVQYPGQIGGTGFIENSRGSRISHQQQSQQNNYKQGGNHKQGGISSQQQQYSPSASISGNMLNSYFVVNGTNPTGSYLGGTGGVGYDPNQVYPEGGDIRVVNDGEGGLTVVRGGGGSSSVPGVPRKLRSVGGGQVDSRNNLGGRQKTTEELHIENDQLRQTVDFLAKRVAALEKADQENNMLKSSIIQFRQDIQKQAKRYGVPSGAAAIGSFTPRFNSADTHIQPLQQRRPPNNSPSSSGLMNSQANLGASAIRSRMAPTTEVPASDIAAVFARVQALEEELRILKETHAMEVGELTKYKERWLKVKESARRKKEERNAAADNSGGIDENIGGMEASMTSSGLINRAPSALDRSGSSPNSTPSPVRKSFAMPTSSLVGDLPFSTTAPPSNSLQEVHEASTASNSSHKTPTASLMFGRGGNSGLPPHTPKMVPPVAASIVMDSSAALLSSHLLDPSMTQQGTTNSSALRTPYSITDMRSRQSSDAAGRRHTPVFNDAPGDMAESGVSSSTSNMFYSAHSFKP